MSLKVGDIIERIMPAEPDRDPPRPETRAQAMVIFFERVNYWAPRPFDKSPSKLESRESYFVVWRVSNDSACVCAVSANDDGTFAVDDTHGVWRLVPKDEQ